MPFEAIKNRYALRTSYEARPRFLWYPESSTPNKARPAAVKRHIGVLNDSAVEEIYRIAAGINLETHEIGLTYLIGSGEDEGKFLIQVKQYGEVSRRDYYICKMPSHTGRFHRTTVTANGLGKHLDRGATLLEQVNINGEIMLMGKLEQESLPVLPRAGSTKTHAKRLLSRREDQIQEAD